MATKHTFIFTDAELTTLMEGLALLKFEGYSTTAERIRAHARLDALRDRLITSYKVAHCMPLADDAANDNRAAP